MGLRSAHALPSSGLTLACLSFYPGAASLLYQKGLTKEDREQKEWREQLRGKFRVRSHSVHTLARHAPAARGVSDDAFLGRFSTSSTGTTLRGRHGPRPCATPPGAAGRPTSRKCRTNRIHWWWWTFDAWTRRRAASIRTGGPCSQSSRKAESTPGCTAGALSLRTFPSDGRALFTYGLGHVWQVHQIPIFNGVPTDAALEALSDVATQPIREWHAAVVTNATQRKKSKVPPLLQLDPDSTVICTLLDGSRYSELDLAHRVAEPNRARLPQKGVPKYAEIAVHL